jgi:Fuc2NAc and GlcNAc transferase
MIYIILPYLILLIFSFTLTYLIKNYAIKKSLVATVNERSSHTVSTPHGGGIALALTWFIGLIYLNINNQIEQNLFYALMLGVMISIVSFFDDIYQLSAKFRLVVQSGIAIGAIVLFGGLNNLDFGLFNIDNQILTNIFAFLLIVWFINLYNFLDGINGYAGSEAVFLALAGFMLFGGSHFIVLAVAVLGFLYWNFGNKAKIFMGDVGSTLLGYNVAIFTLYYANIESRNLWIWLILFGLFWFDATLTLVRRYLNKEKLSVAHKKHAYQRLNQSGWSHFKVTNWSIAINILLFCIVYFILNIALAFLCSLLVLYGMMKFIDRKKAFN